MKSRLLIEMTRCGWRMVDRRCTPTGFSSTDFSLIGNYRTLTEPRWLLRELKGYGRPKIDYLDKIPSPSEPAQIIPITSGINQRYG